MGPISIPLEWSIDAWAVVMTAIAFVYNMLFRRNDLHIIACSFVVVLMYAIGHFVLAHINQMPVEIQVDYRYLYRFMLYFFGIFVLCVFTLRIGINYAVKFVLSILLVCLFMQLSLHIDRNVIGLNAIAEFFATGNIRNNYYFDEGYWWYWDSYTYVLNFSSSLLWVFLLVAPHVREKAVE